MAAESRPPKSANAGDESAKKQAPVVKPEMPDEGAFKKAEADAVKAFEAAKAKRDAVQDKLDNARGGGNKDSPAELRRTELRARLAEIRQKQSGFKDSRQALQEKLRAIEEKRNAKIQEQKNARAKSQFRSVQEIDNKINDLQRQVDSGAMKLVDERKALTEISGLNRQRKNFGSFDAMEQDIARLKADHADVKKQMDNPDAKALSDEYAAIQTELDQIKAENDSSHKNLNALRDERTRLRQETAEKNKALKKLRDEHYNAKRAYRDYEHEAFRIRREKQKRERDEWEAGKRRKNAQARLDEASAPAYGDEIGTAEGLVRYFDPGSVAAKEEAGPGKFAASAQRKIDDSGFKGMRVAKKDDEDYFVGGAGKKKARAKRGAADRAEGAAAEAGAGANKFNLNLGVIEDLAKVGVDPPSTQADVPAVVDRLKQKLEQWRADQERKTKENVAEAQKEIDRLEQEAARHAAGGGTGTGTADEAPRRARDDAKKTAQANAGVNGAVSADRELQQETDAVADVAEELAEAKLEDAAAAAAAA